MKYEEIIKLLDAGYKREEILNMKNEPETDPEPKPDSDPAPDMADVLKEMRDTFADMRKEFIAMNIMNSSQPPDSEKTSEEIIANIINPTKKDGGKDK